MSLTPCDVIMMFTCKTGGLTMETRHYAEHIGPGGRPSTVRRSQVESAMRRPELVGHLLEVHCRHS